MPNELLERKIDTNRTGIEEQELLNFVKDTKNLQELGTHFNKVGMNRGDNLFALSQQEIQKYFPSISQKIKANTLLTENEKSIMKIQYILEKKVIPTNESELNTYLGFKFNNIGYGIKATPKKINIYPKGVGENTETRELTSFERKLQVQTILQAGQYYIQFLKDKGVSQSQHEGDTPSQIVYFNELQTKLSKGTTLNDADVLFYIHQIFYDFSMSGGGYSEKAGAAYKGIDKILTSKEGRNKKNIENKLIEVLYQVRQIDAAKGMKYKSADMLLSTLMQDVSSYKLQRGPESYKLTSSLMGMSLLKPLENGEFVDPLVAKMYTKLKNPSKDVLVSTNGGRGGNALENGNYGDNDIFAVLKKYKLPHEGASISEMYKLQVQLINSIEPLKKKETAEKQSIKTEIIKQKNEEIKNQNTQKEILKKEFLKRKIDVTNSNAQNALAYFDAQITLNTKLIKGESIDIGSTDGKPKKVNLQQIVDTQYKVMENKLISDIVQKGVIYEVLQANKETTNFIRDTKKSGTALTSDEKAVDMLADITGAGVYRSDETFNTAVEVSKELAIQVALMAISGGIANIAARGTLFAIQGGAEFLGAGVYAARVARYANLGKTAFWSSVKFAPEIFAADIIAEGTVFHLVNTSLNAPLQGLSTEQYLNDINPFGTHEELQADGSKKTVSSMMGYAESVAFMGVMKSFGSITNQITKSLGGKTLNLAQQSEGIKNILTANLITLPGEVVAMQGTSAIVGLTFGHDVDLAPQSWAQTLAMVIGLRISHMGTGSLGKISQTIDGKIQEKSMKQGTLDISKVIYDKAGNVQSVEYRVLDATGKVLDQGMASPKTIESAMKEKKGKEEKSPIKEEVKEETTNKSEAKEAHFIEPERFFEMTEAEVKKAFDLQKESIEKDLSSITPETTVEQKKIIAKKVERFTDQIKNILTYVKNNYEFIKTLKGFDRIDYLVKLVDELRLNKGMEELMKNGLDMLQLDDNMTVIALKGVIEGYKMIRMYYAEFKAMRGSGISPNTVRANAELSPEARISKAKDLLGDISSIQKQAILEAHNQAGEIYNLSFGQIKARIEILKKAEFSSEQVRVLMENGICGNLESKDILLPYFDKITNISEYNNTNKIDQISYKKQGKPIQGFDLREYSSIDISSNQNVLKRVYVENILPSMETTDNIKLQIMNDIVNKIGGTIKNAPLKGLKDPSRAIEKIVNDYNGDINKLLDISRGTLVYKNINEVYEAFNTLLTHPEVKSVFVKDNFQRKTGYRDINLVVKVSTGKVFELQINTEKLLESKERGLVISDKYIQEKKGEIEGDVSFNYYGDIVEKIYNKENIFNQRDIELNNRLNDQLERKAKEQKKEYKKIELPQDGDNINGHKMYELTRELEFVLDVSRNEYKEVPPRLKGFTYNEIYTYNQKLINYSNLLYDYAYSISK